MKLHPIDVESIYRRLLTVADAKERESIYRQELLAPFEGMMRFLGGGDPLAMAKMWTLYTPEDFDNEKRATVEELVNRMAAGDAWRRSAAALERGMAAFAPYEDRISLDTVTSALVLTDAGRASSIDGGYAGFGVFRDM
jgi:hypothetical protein